MNQVDPEYFLVQTSDDLHHDVEMEATMNSSQEALRPRESRERNVQCLKKKYYDREKEGLGAITAIRFLHVENELERLVDLQIGPSCRPLIEA